ncbi:hypothetical protein Q8A67_023185 [Cirrhinus molitorella]|uniref:Uncharacterized protein n=1 Tax=Cirrhinus molitorella TaxID=172907 RepID=A0AA88P5L8_9TELE|nr:hypothetical protein Q8A67_023185 [Cirrhinus molitorella]
MFAGQQTDAPKPRLVKYGEYPVFFSCDIVIPSFRSEVRSPAPAFRYAPDHLCYLCRSPKAKPMKGLSADDERESFLEWSGSGYLVLGGFCEILLLIAAVDDCWWISRTLKAYRSPDVRQPA